MPLVRFGKPSKTLLLPYLSKTPTRRSVQLVECMGLTRGIEPPTCGLQKPTDEVSPAQETSDKTGKSLDGSGE